MKAKSSAEVATAVVVPSLKDKLFQAVQASDLEKCKMCIALGVDLGSVDKGRNTALWCAVKGGTLAIAEELARAMSPAQLSLLGKHNQAALEVAISREHYELAQLLVDLGADVENGVKGYTTLMDMASEEDVPVEMVRMLLRAGASPLAQDSTGLSALWHAVRSSTSQSALELIPVSDLSLKVHGKSIFAKACENLLIDVARALASPEAAAELDARGRRPIDLVLSDTIDEERGEMVELLARLSDPWMPMESGMSLLEDFVHDPCRNEEQEGDARVAAALADAMMETDRPLYEVLAALSRVHGMALHGISRGWQRSSVRERY